MFLECPASICIFGGGAGGGKTYSLLLEFLRHFKNALFQAIIFRRNSTQIKSPGGLWDTSVQIYSGLGAHPRRSTLEWTLPSGATLKMAHLENIDTVLAYQGAQLPLIMWDELTHFEKSQFFYMLSRLRSASGVPGYMRATCNPDPDSFVRELIDWWIDEEGYPIPERSGVLRWFIRQDDEMIWGDSREELITKYGEEQLPLSLTFIPSLVQDNKVLMKDDPAYVSNLMALSRIDRLRLLKGNWNARASAGLIFRREWFPIVEEAPGGWIQTIRAWDRAATKFDGTNDPDYTRGLKLYKYPNNTYCVVDLRSTRDTPGQVETLIKNVAGHDGGSVRIVSQQDPGSAGVGEAENFIKMLGGYDVHTVVLSKDKLTRAKPVSAQAEAGNVSVVRAPWNDEFFRELESFPEAGYHDDIVDTLSLSFNTVCHAMSICDALWTG